jgi:hypothetical protein
MKRLALVLAMLLPSSNHVFASGLSPAQQSEINQIRQDLANEVFVFLRDHAVHSEDNPTDWVYDGAYDLHRCAHELYDLHKELKTIVVPISDWRRGGYHDFHNPVTLLQHEYILARIIILIKWGKEKA